MVELVIKLSEKSYQHIKRIGALYIESGNGLEIVTKALLNGKILPEGHGDLIDRKKLQNSIDDKDLISPKDIINIQTLRKWINNQNPIIEADKVEKEEV